jgi:hypothetical protein
MDVQQSLEPLFNYESISVLDEEDLQVENPDLVGKKPRRPSLVDALETRETTSTDETQAKRKRGRPPGSLNKVKKESSANLRKTSSGSSSSSSSSGRSPSQEGNPAKRRRGRPKGALNTKTKEMLFEQARGLCDNEADINAEYEQLCVNYKAEHGYP